MPVADVKRVPTNLDRELADYVVLVATPVVKP